MKILLTVLLMVATPAPAETLSRDACAVLANSAEDAAVSATLMADKSEGRKMAELARTLGSDAKAAAEAVDRTSQAMVAPMRDYAKALTDFAKLMRACVTN
ncbi:hypothetical protein [Mesorhizobium sp. M0847]|uniref:hypothetical protein n=1 Tax=unclassified Mesorhizobium TaxID=325217 RepID=UPI00333D5BB5